MMVGNGRRRVFLHVVLTGALGWPSPASSLSLPAVCPCQLSVPAPPGEREQGGRVSSAPPERSGLLHKCQVSEGGQLPGHGCEVVSFQVPGRGAQ